MECYAINNGDVVSRMTSRDRVTQQIFNLHILNKVVFNETFYIDWLSNSQPRWLSKKMNVFPLYIQ